MKIFYDHQAFSLQDYGGISRIFTELVKILPTLGHDAHLSIQYSNNAHLKEANLQPRGYISNLNIRRRKIIYSINDIFNRYELMKRDYDIYHPTFYNHNLIKYVKTTPVVATYHDMINERFSGKYPELAADKTLIKQKEILASKATRIIAVSENTKKDLIDYYSIAPEKIKVVHLGNSFSTITEPVQPYNGMPYLLYVGNRGLYKNFVPFLESIAQLLVKNNVKLICAGGKSFTHEEISLIKKHRVEKYVIQQSVNDKDLTKLYSSAIAFVFPSLYEGFGIPVLEAFACNCPCVLSNRSSLPEVAGDAAIYMEPDDSESMYKAINSIINEQGIGESLKEKGRERLKKYSWEKHAAETLSLYHEVIQ